MSSPGRPKTRVNPRPILNGITFAYVVVANGTICPRLLVTIVYPSYFSAMGRIGSVEPSVVGHGRGMEELGGVDWESSRDCALGKARLDAIGPNPTDRGKAGSKRSLSSEVLEPIHDTKLLERQPLWWSGLSPLTACGYSHRPPSSAAHGSWPVRPEQPVHTHGDSS